MLNSKKHYASGCVDSATENFANPLLNLKASRAVVLLLIKRAGNGQFVI